MPHRFTQQEYHYFMDKALFEAESALRRGDFPVGCVITDGKDIVASGSREGSTGQRPNEIDHAEIMALRRLGALSEAVDPSGLALFCTLEPCLMCYGAILLSGISEIVYAYEDVMGGGTGCHLGALPPLYAQRQIIIAAGVRRKESLVLFQAFFGNPDNDYWRASYLADYTLGQP
ncbi:MAG: nucleoside deaminase [Pseudomonadota bacterium]